LDIAFFVPFVPSALRVLLAPSCLRLKWIYQGDAGRREMSDVSGGDGQAMFKRGRGDPEI
jgi:hypothetical protein